MPDHSAPISASHNGAMPRALARRSLLVVTAFSCVSAVGGGLGIVVSNGLGMPRSLLNDGPFASFFWPGVILLVVVGGTQTLALVLLGLRARSRLLAGAVAGFGMIIWITVEIGVIHELSWPQVIYLGAGVLQVSLVCVELGILEVRSPGSRTGTRVSASPSA
jgi:hypothetical protein